MKQRKLICTILGMAFVLHAQAQTEPQVSPPPSGVLFQKRAPVFSQWTVFCNPAKVQSNTVADEKGGVAAAKAPKFSQIITVTKTKNIIQEQILGANGQRKETWSVDNLQYLTIAGSSERQVMDRGAIAKLYAAGIDFTDFSKTDFPGLEWVTPNDYVGTSKVMGRDCILFSKTDPEKPQFTFVAHVDMQTRLPVLLQKDNEIRVYQFGAPPQAMLALPRDLQQDLERRAKEREWMARMPARPY